MDGGETCESRQFNLIQLLIILFHAHATPFTLQQQEEVTRFTEQHYYKLTAYFYFTHAYFCCYLSLL